MSRSSVHGLPGASACVAAPKQSSTSRSFAVPSVIRPHLPCNTTSLMERDRLPRQPGLAGAARVVEGAQQRQYYCYGRAWLGAATVVGAPRVSATTVARAPTAHRPSNSCGGHARLASPSASLGPRATAPPRHPPYAWPYHNNSPARQLHPKKAAAPPLSPPQGPMVRVPNVVRPARPALGFTSSLSAPRTPPSRTRSVPTSPHPGSWG